MINRNLAKKWWDNEVNVVTWSDPNYDLQVDEDGLTFFERNLSAIADRCCHFYDKDADYSEVIELYKSNGLKTISFVSILDWDIEKSDLYIEEFKKHIDSGCDGVHMDMLFMPSKPDNGVIQTKKIVDALKKYALDKYNRKVLITGNTWMLTEENAVKQAQVCDLAWLESHGKDEMEIIRFVRLGKSLNNGQNTVWYHLQPDNNEFEKIRKLKNYPKALMSSCMMEGGVFLKNPQYPIFDTFDYDEGSASKWEGQEGVWKFERINKGWENSIEKYSSFKNRFRELYANAEALSNLVLVFSPDEIVKANLIMDYMISNNIDYNVKTYGEQPFNDLKADDISQYKYVLALKSLDFALPQNIKVINETEIKQMHISKEIDRLFYIKSRDRVAGRLFRKGKKLILHLKQLGYDDKNDYLSDTEPFEVILKTSNRYKVTLVSPDTNDELSIVSYLEGENLTLKIPSIQYYSLLIYDPSL